MTFGDNLADFSFDSKHHVSPDSISSERLQVKPCHKQGKVVRSKQVRQVEKDTLFPTSGTSEHVHVNTPSEQIPEPAGDINSKQTSKQKNPLYLHYNQFRHTWSQRRCTSSESISWPTTTSTACWWCCHTFSSVPVPLPTTYCAKTDSFTVTGTFCSWSCAKAYANTTTKALHACELISLMRYKLTGKYVPTKLAPSRKQLTMFGGSMCIDTFRAACEFPNRQVLSVNIQSQPFGVLSRPITQNAFGNTANSNVPELPNGADTEDDIDRKKNNISFTNIAAKKNEPLKLKRTKPVTKGKTVLEKVLGLTFTPINEH